MGAESAGPAGPEVGFAVFEEGCLAGVDPPVGGFAARGDGLLVVPAALGWSVVRIALAAGISGGLFAPTRPAWRLANPSDTISERIVRVAITVASLVSITRLLEALNEIINASPAFSVATRGVGATVAAVALGVHRRLL